MPIDEQDERTIRCKRLGHPVSFRYCRLQEGCTICHHILNCWWEVFDVRAFLEENLPEEEMQRLLNPQPKPKVLSLLELIEKAKEAAAKKED